MIGLMIRLIAVVSISGTFRAGLIGAWRQGWKVHLSFMQDRKPWIRWEICARSTSDEANRRRVVWRSATSGGQYGVKYRLRVSSGRRSWPTCGPMGHWALWAVSDMRRPWARKGQPSGR